MKKTISLILLFTLLVFTLFSCAPKDDTQIRIGYMAGPTGMGMSKLIHDNGGPESGNEKYAFTKYTDTKLATADLTAGKIDVICLPTNEAASYYANDNDIRVLSINTLGSLYLVTDKNTTITSFDDLQGKTIYTCKNGTPKIILEYLLTTAGIEATVSYTVDNKEVPTPNQLGEMLIAGKVDIAVVPEPVVTSSLLKIKANGDDNISYTVDLNLNDVWNEECDTALTMGCIVASREFIDDHSSVVKDFLNEYKASIEFVNNSENLDTAADYVVETGVMQAIPAAKSALTNLNGSIAYIDGTDMKNALIEFYRAIGIEAPKDEFYYEK